MAVDSVPAVEARDLSRSFGRVKALDGFEVRLPHGQVTALVGPNGAGKTTLLLVLASLLAPDRGVARIAGADCATQPEDVHAAVGWMPDFFGVYDDLTPREYLELFGAAYRLTPTASATRARELLASVGLEAKADAPVHTLSRGQKQRLGFARTIVHEPRVLLLDEPASGLDPHARIQLRNLVRDQARSGAAVVISSHILAELEEMSDLVVFMDRGGSKGTFPVRDLPRHVGLKTWRIRALDGSQLEDALDRAGTEWNRVVEGTADVCLPRELDAAELLARLVRDEVPVVEMTMQSGGLEEVFLSMSGEREP